MPKKNDIQKNMNKYLSRIEAAEKHRDNSFKELWKRCYKRYRNYVDPIIDPDTKKESDRSNISIPYTFVQVETIKPRLKETLFASRPYITVKDREPSDLDNAHMMETLLDWQMCERMDMMEIFAHGLTELCIYGTAIAYVGWKWSEKEVIKKQPAEVLQMNPLTGIEEPLIDPLTQSPITELKPFRMNEIDYDDPEVKFIDLGLFYVDPNAVDIDDARYCGHDEFQTKEELQKLVDQGIYKIDWKKVPKDKALNQAKSDRLSAVGLPTSDDQIEESSEDNLYRVTHYWEDDKHVVILNRAYIAMDSENPFWHKQKPYKKGVYTAVPHEFYGIGVVEMIEDLQDELNAERNMRIDFRKYALRPMIKTRMLSPAYTEKWKWRLAGRLPVNEMDDADVLFMPDATANSFNQESVIKQDIQDCSGAHDVVMGTANSKETATSTMTKDNNASMRFRATISTIEKRLLCGIARLMMAMNQQFVDAERVFRLTNDGQDGWLKLSPEEIQGEFDLYAAGSSVEPIANKEAAKQRMVELYNVLTNDPLMQQFPDKRRNLLKKILESFDIKDTDSILPDDNELQMMMQPQIPPGMPTDPMAAQGGANMPMMQEGGMMNG
jgi:hypothetical protein